MYTTSERIRSHFQQCHAHDGLRCPVGSDCGNETGAGGCTTPLRSTVGNELARVLLRIRGRVGQRHHRSEEHTSELQSLMRISYAVFCLKQKRNIHKKTHEQHTTTHNMTNQTNH